MLVDLSQTALAFTQITHKALEQLSSGVAPRLRRALASSAQFHLVWPRDSQLAQVPQRASLHCPDTGKQNGPFSLQVLSVVRFAVLEEANLFKC